ncbi:MAG: serine/threonine protein kinase [Leptolyngbya sp. SIO1E4]|nr:serine/threonine protein kinase [Leptolyngbya sp. SIO1E4]
MTTLCINPQCSHPENPDDRDRCLSCGAKLRLGNRFRPSRQLGQGGFGRTFSAWDEAQTPPQHCVIKQILRSQGSRDRDWQEAHRLSHLGQHPQIPDLIAVLESSRDICLVQTYIPGQTLEQVLAADGPFSESQVRSLLLSLLPVLQFIHDHDIIHRDIKPENILLPGGDRPPVLVDFGAAREIPSATSRERTGTIIGSAGYAAPEQALGKAIAASDLYSLGMTCLHLLTEQHPFDLYSVTEDRAVWQPFLPHPISPALARILDRLTARSVRSRYSSAAAALADLAPAGILAPAPLTALPPLPAKPWHCVATWPTSGRTVNALAISPDGRAIATANSDHSVQLWDQRTGEVLHTFAQRFGLGHGHSDAVTAVQFHPNGHTLFTGSQDSTLKQWDLSTYRLQQTLKSSGWPLTTIALTPAGNRLITAAANGHLTVWQLPRGKPMVDLVRHQGAVNAVALSPDGTRLASVGEAGTLRLWTLPEGQLLHTWTAKGDRLCSVAFSIVDPALITGSGKGRVTVWSLTDFQHDYALSQHQDEVRVIALSPDGRLLATGSRDREIHLWDWSTPSKHRLAVLHHDWAVCDLMFTADSRTLISSASDETIRFWQAAT